MAEAQNTGGEGPCDGWLEELFKRQLAKTTDGGKEDKKQKTFQDNYGVRFFGQGDEGKGLQIVLEIVAENKKEKDKCGTELVSASVWEKR